MCSIKKNNLKSNRVKIEIFLDGVRSRHDMCNNPNIRASVARGTRSPGGPRVPFFFPTKGIRRWTQGPEPTVVPFRVPTILSFSFLLFY